MRNTLNKPHPQSTFSSARLRPAMALTLVGALVGATVACSLNPQPLPPDDDDRIAADPTGAPSTGGGNFSDAESSPRDAGTPPLAPDGAPAVDGGGADAAPADASVDAAPDAAPDAAADATRD